MVLVARLVLLATKNGNPLRVMTSGWVARPTVIHPLQTNGVDCGVWVIANVAAVLSGFVVTGIHEHDISLVRTSLVRTLGALPVVT